MLLLILTTLLPDCFLCCSQPDRRTSGKGGDKTNINHRLYQDTCANDAAAAADDDDDDDCNLGEIILYFVSLHLSCRCVCGGSKSRYIVRYFQRRPTILYSWKWLKVSFY